MTLWDEVPHERFIGKLHRSFENADSSMNDEDNITCFRLKMAWHHFKKKNFSILHHSIKVQLSRTNLSAFLAGIHIQMETILWESSDWTLVNDCLLCAGWAETENRQWIEKGESLAHKVLSRVPFHFSVATGFFHRSSPIGGSANGIFWKEMAYLSEGTNNNEPWRYAPQSRHRLCRRNLLVFHN